MGRVGLRNYVVSNVAAFENDAVVAMCPPNVDSSPECKNYRKKPDPFFLRIALPSRRTTTFGCSAR